MKNFILGLSLLFASIYVFFLLVDILRTAHSKLKGTDYKWSTSGIFQECQSWYNVLLLGVLLFLGLYSMGSEYARIKVKEATGEMTYCESCKKEVPSKYAIYYYGNFVCPHCLDGFYNDEISWYADKIEDNEKLLIDGRSIRDIESQVNAEYGMTPAEAFSVIDEYEYDYTHGGYTWAEYQDALEVMYYTMSIFPYDY